MGVRTVPAKGKTIHGIDVSKYQGTIDWKEIAKEQKFAFIRVSDGIRYPDPKFGINWRRARGKGIRQGVYQFFRPAQSVAEQLDLMFGMLEEAGGLVAGDLPCALDLETTDGCSPSLIEEGCLEWMTQVEERTKLRPILYVGPAFWLNAGLSEKLAKFPLWIAHYTTRSGPWVPTEWATWTMWQYSGSGSVAGVSVITDTNWFNGTQSELEVFIRNSQVQQPEPEPEPQSEPQPNPEPEPVEEPNVGSTPVTSIEPSSIQPGAIEQRKGCLSLLYSFLRRWGQ
jgi:lysozyme